MDIHLHQDLVVADRFRLRRRLRAGGMGTVWLAEQTRLNDAPCAIKFIHPTSAESPEFRLRFQREAEVLATLRSPHIVSILDYGEWQDGAYIAMEFLEGEDLAQRLKRQTQLSPTETRTIATHVGRGLTKAHAANLVHRDIKPGNIFLVCDDDQEIAKVLDFGVAKAHTGEVQTKTGELLGTIHYMSPEQAQSMKDVDHRSDLWALAVVVYQCLTGKHPFAGEATYVVLSNIVKGPIPVPSHIADLPVSFDAWWARAVMRDRAQRFQTAAEMTEALAVALANWKPQQRAEQSQNGARREHEASKTEDSVEPSKRLPAVRFAAEQPTLGVLPVHDARTPSLVKGLAYNAGPFADLKDDALSSGDPVSRPSQSPHPAGSWWTAFAESVVAPSNWLWPVVLAGASLAVSLLDESRVSYPWNILVPVVGAVVMLGRAVRRQHEQLLRRPHSARERHDS